MNDQPQEWTPEYVYRELIRNGVNAATRIADAHNAELSARIRTTEYAQGWDDHLAASRKQLDAERGLVQWCPVHAPTPDEPIKCCPCCEAVHEREKVKTLSELLGEFRMKLDWSVIDGTDLERIDNTLVKAKET